MSPVSYLIIIMNYIFLHTTALCVSRPRSPRTGRRSAETRLESESDGARGTATAGDGARATAQCQDTSHTAVRLLCAVRLSSVVCPSPVCPVATRGAGDSDASTTLSPGLSAMQCYSALDSRAVSPGALCGCGAAAGGGGRDGRRRRPTATRHAPACRSRRPVGFVVGVDVTNDPGSRSARRDKVVCHLFEARRSESHRRSM